MQSSVDYLLGSTDHRTRTWPVILEEPPVVRAEMLIRRPATDVYRAFVDPSVTTRFWFTHSSGELESGSVVTWNWAMYGASAEVRVLDLRPSERILIEWDDRATRVEWLFTARPDGTTFVSITNLGFVGTGDEVVRRALDSMGGFSFLLAAAKAWLEHGVELNLVADHYPDSHVSHGGAPA